MTEVYRLVVILVICVIGGWQTFEGFVLGAPAKHAVQKVGQAIHDLSA
jgi:ABC-type branched-subunit amino acid transport system permease subunit